MKSFELTTEKTRSSWTVTLTIDRQVYQTSFTARPEDHYMMVKLTCPHSNEYQLESSAIENGYQVQLSRKEEGKSSVDALVAVSMNESKTINGKLYWNPALYSELKVSITTSALVLPRKQFYPSRFI